MHREMRDIQKCHVMGYDLPLSYAISHRISAGRARSTTSPDQILRLPREMPHLPALLPRRYDIS
jgi:hypothetical protein